MKDNEILSDSESDGYKTISYAVMCNDLSETIKGEEITLGTQESSPDRNYLASTR